MSRIIFLLVLFTFFKVDVNAQSWKKYLKKSSTETKKASELLEPKKITKRGLYFEIGIPDINSQSNSRWSSIFREDISDSIYFHKQISYKYNYTFAEKLSNSLVFYQKIKLFSALDLVTGIGINRLKYRFQPVITSSDVFLISKFEVISESVYIPGQVKEKKFANPQYNSPNNSISYAGGFDVNYSIFSLILPASLQFHLTKRIDINLNVGLTLPVITHATRKSYDFEKGMDVDVTDKLSNIMTRYLISTGVGIKYRFYKNYFFGLDYSIFQNSLLHPSETNKYENDYIKKINMTNLGLKLGLEW